ncbi:hypothetical protein [Pseudoxanthomonas sp. PXM02]|uniref:hypothetical protein n=1 Tax=Pseudoxanthomonas sp. PXM02 TaxID=2769294 RepID=UPI00177E7175|nr:hypothetical protein [Pseudoxanthomonas sp. PXM02]MBD9478386.1 hypothetical protein [Pseudoxanthomonas sp. PXM02]
MRAPLLLIAMAFSAVGCGRATPVSVDNQSGGILEDVVISGSGFEQPLGDIATGVTATTMIFPKGESGLEVSFHSQGRHVVLPPSGYFEGGGQYAVTVVVTPDLGADVDADLRPY